MTTIIDLVSKTRILHHAESALNMADPKTLRDWKSALAARPIGDLITAIRQPDGPFRINDDDFNHLMNEGFHRDGNGWWGPHVESILTEGVAQLIDRMLCEPSGEARKKPAKIDMWWLSPATYYFRTVVLESPFQITFLVVTPPKGDHPIHYGQYKARLSSKRKEDDLAIPANYTKLENIWVTSHLDDSLKTNAGGVAVAELVPSITGKTEIETVRLLAQEYEEGL